MRKVNSLTVNLSYLENPMIADFDALFYYAVAATCVLGLLQTMRDFFTIDRHGPRHNIAEGS